MLTLLTSGSTYAFVTDDLDPNFNTVFATRSGDSGGKDISTPTPKQTDNKGGGTTSNLPIVLKQLPSGDCPAGYQLVSGVVCIKDITTKLTTPTSSSNNGQSSGQQKFQSLTPAQPLQPECTPGYHWDRSQQECDAKSANGP
jgi:hypothetical protein